VEFIRYFFNIWCSSYSSVRQNGLKSTVIPSNKWIELQTEHDLMKMMKSIKINDNQMIDDNLLDNQLEEEEEEEEDNISD
jgi:hypothetical protein